jgi:hypothetical protein
MLSVDLVLKFANFVGFWLRKCELSVWFVMVIVVISESGKYVVLLCVEVVVFVDRVRVLVWMKGCVDFEVELSVVLDFIKGSVSIEVFLVVMIEIEGGGFDIGVIFFCLLFGLCQSFKCKWAGV